VADENAIKVIQEDIIFTQAISSRVDDIIKSKNQPDLANNQMLMGFKHGLTEHLALALDYYSQMEKTYQTGDEIYRILKTNLGHLHADGNGRRVIDDAAVQKQYDVALAANLAANQQMAKDQTQLIEIQKQNLQKSF
jgi:hypothetical protein